MPTTDANKFDSDASAAPTSEADTPRAWWFAERSQEFRTFRQYEETLVYLRGILEKQHFDGVFGFSQGAACAAILAALCENPQLDPVFAKPSEDPNVTWPPPPFKFAILSAGFFPLDPRTSAYFETPLKTPTLHVLGRADTIVGEERSVPLTKVFHDARVEWHDGGESPRAPGLAQVWIKSSLADGATSQATTRHRRRAGGDSSSLTWRHLMRTAEASRLLWRCRRPQPAVLRIPPRRVAPRLLPPPMRPISYRQL